jgi:hypothetical protein
MHSNWFRWLVRGVLVAILAALLLVSRLGGYPSAAFPSWQLGDVAIVALILAGVGAAGFLVWQSRWR